jgi:predicted component of type VI protein secretion system
VEDEKKEVEEKEVKGEEAGKESPLLMRVVADYKSKKGKDGVAEVFYCQY